MASLMLDTAAVELLCDEDAEEELETASPETFHAMLPPPRLPS